MMATFVGFTDGVSAINPTRREHRMPLNGTAMLDRDGERLCYCVMQLL
jgi:hypothetical protein